MNHRADKIFSAVAIGGLMVFVLGYGLNISFRTMDCVREGKGNVSVCVSKSLEK